MNIFYFTNNAELNAKMLDDKRLVKMVLETTQLLSNGLFLNGKKNVPYKPTHLKHPCSIWAAKSTANWRWLKQYGLALAKEYTRRYGKIHKCEMIINNMKCPKINDNNFYDLPQCMPIEYKSYKATSGYIKYYIGVKFNYNYFKRANKKVYKFWERLYDKSYKQK